MRFSAAQIALFSLGVFPFRTSSEAITTREPSESRRRARTVPPRRNLQCVARRPSPRTPASEFRSSRRIERWDMAARSRCEAIGQLEPAGCQRLQQQRAIPRPRISRKARSIDPCEGFLQISWCARRNSIASPNGHLYKTIQLFLIIYLIRNTAAMETSRRMSLTHAEDEGMGCTAGAPSGAPRSS